VLEKTNAKDKDAAQIIVQASDQYEDSANKETVHSIAKEQQHSTA
jgi:hypothetical protein